VCSTRRVNLFLSRKNNPCYVGRTFFFETGERLTVCPTFSPPSFSYIDRISIISRRFLYGKSSVRTLLILAAPVFSARRGRVKKKEIRPRRAMRFAGRARARGVPGVVVTVVKLVDVTFLEPFQRSRSVLYVRIYIKRERCARQEKYFDSFVVVSRVRSLSACRTNPVAISRPSFVGRRAVNFGRRTSRDDDVWSARTERALPVVLCQVIRYPSEKRFRSVFVREKTIVFF